MHVEHFMTKNPVACDVAVPVSEVARLMAERSLGSVVVLRNNKVVGIVTDRQIACKVVGQQLPLDTPVEEVMTESPARLTLEDNVFSAIDTLRSAGVVRRVPVVNRDNELLGVVSIADIAIIAKDLMEAVLLDETHTAMEEVKLLTGAKRFVHHLRKPLAGPGELPLEPETKPVLVTPPLGASAGVAGGQFESGPGVGRAQARKKELRGEAPDRSVGVGLARPREGRDEPRKEVPPD